MSGKNEARPAGKECQPAIYGFGLCFKSLWPPQCGGLVLCCRGAEVSTGSQSHCLLTFKLSWHLRWGKHETRLLFFVVNRKTDQQGFSLALKPGKLEEGNVRCTSQIYSAVYTFSSNASKNKSTNKKKLFNNNFLSKITDKNIYR